jgi:hypothetical protein
MGDAVVVAFSTDIIYQQWVCKIRVKRGERRSTYKKSLCGAQMASNLNARVMLVMLVMCTVAGSNIL